MQVFIIETKTGRVAAQIEIHLGGVDGYTPTNQEYFDDAWREAVSDKSVDPARRADYTFKLAP